MNTKPTTTAAKVVTAGIALTLLLSASPAFAQTAQNQAFRPQLALFEGFSSWFNQLKESFVPPPAPATSVFVTPNSTISGDDAAQSLYHGQNILNRLQDKYTDLDKTITTLNKQVDDLTTRGFDTSKIKVFTDLAQDKLSVARYDIGTATSTMVMVPDDQQSTSEDIRTTLKAADESVRTASQAVAAAKAKVRDFMLKNRKTVSN